MPGHAGALWRDALFEKPYSPPLSVRNGPILEMHILRLIGIYALSWQGNLKITCSSMLGEAEDAPCSIFACGVFFVLLEASSPVWLAI